MSCEKGIAKVRLVIEVEASQYADIDKDTVAQISAKAVERVSELLRLKIDRDDGSALEVNRNVNPYTDAVAKLVSTRVTFVYATDTESES